MVLLQWAVAPAAVNFVTSITGNKTFDKTVALIQMEGSWRQHNKWEFFFGGGIINNGTFVAGTGNYITANIQSVLTIITSSQISCEYTGYR